MRLVRVVALASLVYFLGFAAFMLSLKGEEDPRRTDGLVVLTGGPGRIGHALTLLQGGAAKRLLISGADPSVRPNELAAEYRTPRRLFACCIDLGAEAVDTRSNAEETARWVRSNRYRSVRLVTADWHMPRSELELRYALDDTVEIIGDPVATNPPFAMLVREYNKYLVRRAALLAGY